MVDLWSGPLLAVEPLLGPLGLGLLLTSRDARGFHERPDQRCGRNGKRSLPLGKFKALGLAQSETTRAMVALPQGAEFSDLGPA